jgi:hypothetical protein
LQRAIVEVELLVIINDGVRVERGAEKRTTLRHAADDARFGRQCQMLEDMLLGSDRRDAFRHADTEIDHAARSAFDG